MSRPFHPLKLSDGSPDRRYVAALEWCGYSKRRWVARFCGEWIGQGKHHSDATMLALVHADERAREIESLAKVTP